MALILHSALSSPNINYLEATRVHTAPSAPGLYAWYYRPRNLATSQLASQIANLCIGPAHTTSSLRLDYGLRFETHAESKTQTSDGKSLHQVIEDALAESSDILPSTLSQHLAPFFTRPIYIGMAKSLRVRLYEGHFKEMLDLWEPNHPVSLFLDTIGNFTEHPSKIIDKIAGKLGIGHSFALEARVRGFALSDLFIVFVVMENSSGDESKRGERRAAERLLQLVCLPVCGKI